MTESVFDSSSNDRKVHDENIANHRRIRILNAPFSPKIIIIVAINEPTHYH